MPRMPRDAATNGSGANSENSTPYGGVRGQIASFPVISAHRGLKFVELKRAKNLICTGALRRPAPPLETLPARKRKKPAADTELSQQLLNAAVQVKQHSKALADLLQRFPPDVSVRLREVVLTIRTNSETPRTLSSLPRTP